MDKFKIQMGNELDWFEIKFKLNEFKFRWELGFIQLELIWIEIGSIWSSFELTEIVIKVE